MVQKMFKKYVLKSVFMLSSISIFIALSSCRKDDEEPTQDGNHYRITYTLNDVNPSDDFVSLAIAGSTSDPSVKTIWKVNGVEQPNQNGLGFGDDDFAGATKTYVIETIRPLLVMNAGGQIINYGQDLSFTIKIEKNGKVEINEEKTLTGDGSNWNKTFNF